MEIIESHALAPYSTFQIGGPADFFMEAKSVEDCVAGLDWAREREVPVFVFGGGSNLLFDDSGFRGLMIRMRAQSITVEGTRIHAEAGAITTVLVMEAMKARLTGLEEWNGLPGSVGGAVFGNAGCFGVESKDVLESAELYFPGSGVRRVEREYFEYEYRHSRIKEAPGPIVLRATFALQPGEPEAIAERMKEIVKLRAQKQPAGLNTGSFFKNPSPDKPAGWLIDQCGLKGERVGGAQISEQHANFFANTGGATAADVLALSAKATQAVQNKFGIQLQREVVYVPPQ